VTLCATVAPLPQIRQLQHERGTLKAERDKLRVLLSDPEVQPVAALRLLGLSSRGGAECAPLVSIVHVPTVAATLCDSNVPVKDAVVVIAGYLKSNGGQLTAYLDDPVLRMRGSTDIYTGKKWSSNIDNKATAVALALIAARSKEVRQGLKGRLVPKFTGGQNDDVDWADLNKRLFSERMWEDSDRQKAEAVRDVLEFTVDGLLPAGEVDGLRSFWKYERVAAALMLGLLMQQGLMV
jgi:hypothetical protein